MWCVTLKVGREPAGFAAAGASATGASVRPGDRRNRQSGSIPVRSRVPSRSAVTPNGGKRSRVVPTQVLGFKVSDCQNLFVMLINSTSTISKFETILQN